jgi:putative ABC transport system substrate-binding protein
MVKVIFSSVTDPIAARLVDDYKKTDKNITGVSNFVDLGQQLNLFEKIQPQLKKIGMLYNASEVNSVVIVDRMKKICASRGIEIVPQIVQKTADISQATLKLAPTVDAIFVSNDNTVLSSLQNVINIGANFKIPVYVSDTDAVELGCVCALGPNQVKIGEQTAKMVLRVLEKNSTSGIPVEFPSDSECYVNLDAARRLDMTIPKEIIARSQKVIGLQRKILPQDNQNEKNKRDKKGGSHDRP